jgi:hypothetical protein
MGAEAVTGREVVERAREAELTTGTDTDSVEDEDDDDDEQDDEAVVGDAIVVGAVGVGVPAVMEADKEGNTGAIPASFAISAAAAVAAAALEQNSCTRAR